MRWAISGGAGFLGLHLARRLLADGHEVRTLDLAPLDDAELEGGVEELRGDVRSPRDAAALVDGARVLVHAAAALPIQVSRESIRSVNVGGTATLLAAAAEAGVKRVVLVSSTAVYGIPKVHPIHEDDPLVGVGAYGESKIEAEQVTRDFGRRGLDFVIVRPKTFIGPERLGVFEILFDWIRDGRRIYTLGDGSNRYQLLAVEDLVEAIVLAARRRAAAGETVNVGAKEFGTVRDDLQALIDHAGSSSRLTKVPVRPAEVALRALELARALATRGVALQDGAPRLVRRDRQGRGAARLDAEALERRGAVPDVRLVPRAPRLAGEGRRHAPRAVEPAGARAAEADQLGSDVGARHRRLGERDAVLDHACEVERQRFSHLPLNVFYCLTGGDASQDIRGPRRVVRRGAAFDQDEVFLGLSAEIGHFNPAC